jgi:hypothetical protein
MSRALGRGFFVDSQHSGFYGFASSRAFSRARASTSNDFSAAFALLKRSRAKTT